MEAAASSYILDMSGFDIIWLLVCIGLPVVSGILSAGKKQKAKTKAGEPVGKRDFLEDLIKEVTKELKEYNSSGDKSIDDEKEDSGRTPASSATDGRLSPAASSHKAAAYAESRHSGERNGGMETRHGTTAEPSAARPSVTYGKRVPSMRPATAGSTATEPALQMADTKAGVERIDPRRMIIYDAVLNPKFRE